MSEQSRTDQKPNNSSIMPTDRVGPMRNAMREDYTRHYQKYENDSFVASRNLMIKKIKKNIDQLRSKRNMDPNQVIRILDIGAGRQKISNEFFIHFPEEEDRVAFTTLDIADMKASQLSRYHTHVQADAAKLPFADYSFDIVLSNLAIDFCDRKSFSESWRMLKKDGVFIANLHDPDFIEIARTKMWACMQQIRENPDNAKAKTQYHRYKNVIDQWPEMIFSNREALEDFLYQEFAVEKIEFEFHQTDNQESMWIFCEIDLNNIVQI